VSIVFLDVIIYKSWQQRKRFSDLAMDLSFPKLKSALKGTHEYSGSVEVVVKTKSDGGIERKGFSTLFRPMDDGVYKRREMLNCRRRKLFSVKASLRWYISCMLMTCKKKRPDLMRFKFRLRFLPSLGQRWTNGVCV